MTRRWPSRSSPPTTKIDRARERVEDTAFNLLSLQQPVAGDLRVVVSALRMVSELERMGDLSVHVAKIARLRVPEIAVPEAARKTIARMGEVAEDMVRRVAAVITERDVEAAIELGRDDEEMDQLRRTSFTQLLSDDWEHGVEAAVDIALLGRYYERIADHAVSVANRVVFVVTGQYPVAVEPSVRGTRTLRGRGRVERAGERRDRRVEPSRTQAAWTVGLDRLDRRPLGFDPLPALVRDCRGGFGGGVGVEVAAARDRGGQVVAQLVDQRHPGRDVERGDRHRR